VEEVGPATYIVKVEGRKYKVNLSIQVPQKPVATRL